MAGGVTPHYDRSSDATGAWRFPQIIVHRVLMNMAPRIFLSNETTTVKIGGVGKLTVKPFEESYDFTPGH